MEKKYYVTHSDTVQVWKDAKDTSVEHFVSKLFKTTMVVLPHKNFPQIIHMGWILI